MAATGMRFLGSGHPPLHRFRLGLEFMLSGHREVDGMVESHSHIARMLGEQLGLPETVLYALASSYERWDGRGWPGDLRGNTDETWKRGMSSLIRSMVEKGQGNR